MTRGWRRRLGRAKKERSAVIIKKTREWNKARRRGETPPLHRLPPPVYYCSVRRGGTRVPYLYTALTYSCVNMEVSHKRSCTRPTFDACAVRPARATPSRVGPALTPPGVVYRCSFFVPLYWWVFFRRGDDCRLCARLMTWFFFRLISLIVNWRTIYLKW